MCIIDRISTDPVCYNSHMIKFLKEFICEEHRKFKFRGREYIGLGFIWFYSWSHFRFYFLGNGNAFLEIFSAYFAVVFKFIESFKSPPSKYESDFLFQGSVFQLAEGGGFEPPRGFLLYRISSAAR